MFETLLRTVFSLRSSRRAIARFSSPLAMRARISRSRGVRSGKAANAGVDARRPGSVRALADARPENRLTLGDREHCAQDLGRVRALEDVSGGARADRLGDRAVVVHHRHHQHGDVRMGLGEPASCRHAVEAGHRDVHDDDVGPQLARERDGLLAVGGFADEFGLGRVTQQRADPLPEERMVVGDQHPDGSRSQRRRNERQRGAHQRAVRLASRDRDLAPELCARAPASRGCRRRDAHRGQTCAGVGDLQLEIAAGDGDAHVHRSLGGVLRRVRHRLGGDPIRGDLDVRRQRRQVERSRNARARKAVNLVAQRKAEPEVVENRRAQVVGDAANLGDGAFRFAAECRHQVARHGGRIRG